MSDAQGKAIKAAWYEAMNEDLDLGCLFEGVETFLDELNDNGFDVVPIVVSGSAGLRPDLLESFQRGVMWHKAMLRDRKTNLVGRSPDEASLNVDEW